MKARLISRIFPALCAGAMTALCSMGGCPPATAQWSQFHGDGGQGLVADSVLPDSWSGDNPAWSVSLDSFDVGSPTIHNGRVFLLAHVEDAAAIELRCFDLKSGDLIWERRYDQVSSRTHSRNTLASGTPSVDDSGVVFAFAEPDSVHLVAVDHDGNDVWHRDLGRWQSSHGFGTSPRLVDDQVVMLVSLQANELKEGQTPGESHLVSVDRKSGVDRWKTKLKATRTCYGLPAMVRRGDQTMLVEANTGNGVFAVDASDGAILWETPVLKKRVCSSPLVVGDRVICTHGGGGRGEVFAVDMPTGDKPAPTLAFEIKRNSPYVPTSAVKGDRLFMAADIGIVSCVDIESGDIVWTKRIGGDIGASPIIIGDKLMVIDLAGKATVMRATDEYEKLSQVDFGDKVGATPAVAEGHLVVRVGNELRAWTLED